MTQELFEKIENAKGRVFNIVDFERYVGDACAVSADEVTFYENGTDKVVLPIVSYFGSFEIDDARYDFAEPCEKGRFTFYQDRKVTAWHRAKFTVKAKSKEDAIAIVVAMKDEDPNYMDNDNIEVYENDLVYDTMEDLSPEENGKQSTTETYGDGDVLIYDNNIQ